METIQYTEEMEYILQAIVFDFELGPRILVLGQTSCTILVIKHGWLETSALSSRISQATFDYQKA